MQLHDISSSLYDFKLKQEVFVKVCYDQNRVIQATVSTQAKTYYYVITHALNATFSVIIGTLFLLPN